MASHLMYRPDSLVLLLIIKFKLSILDSIFNFSNTEVEMHRNKVHQEANSSLSSDDLEPKRQQNEVYEHNTVNKGIGQHQPQENVETSSSEEKKQHGLNYSIESIEAEKNLDSSLHNPIKDEDPSSVTSSGCSPPTQSNMNNSGQQDTEKLRSKENRNITSNFYSNIKPELSSTKTNNNPRPMHVDDRHPSGRTNNVTSKMSITGHGDKKG